MTSSTHIFENFAPEFPENRSGEAPKNQWRNTLQLYSSTLMKTKIAFLIALLIACLSLSQNADAVTPSPDGGYPGGNTAEGDNALLNLTSGSYDTAIGYLSLENA
jgi:hypothetical protein